jgi:Zn-dependent protease
MSPAQTEAANACLECGSALDRTSLSCAKCGRLRYSAELEDLAKRASQAAPTGDLRAVRDLWKQALTLLPPDTVQYRAIQGRIDDLTRQIDAAPVPNQTGWKKTMASGAGPAVLLLLGKGKLLLLGLTKLSTLLSMFAFFGVYWSMYGWVFALGLVLSIYIHEMGHVTLLRSYGIPASAPMFIPGFGAFISIRGRTLEPVQDSRVGLAGPLYGLGSALLFLLTQSVTGSMKLAAIAHAAAVINLFNLIPVWQLDGSRGLHSLTRMQRVILLFVAVTMWGITSEKMLLLVAFGLTYRLFTKDQASDGDDVGLMQYAGLLVALPAVAYFAARIFPAAALTP